MAILQKFKIGDTLLLSGVYKINGIATSLENYVIRSELRKKGDLITEFDVVIPNQSQLANVGLFTMTIDADTTSSWSPGLYVCDIEFTVDGIVRSTETFEIPVIEGITRPVVTP